VLADFNVVRFATLRRGTSQIPAAAVDGLFSMKSDKLSRSGELKPP
jgi:hypothetical protein